VFLARGRARFGGERLARLPPGPTGLGSLRLNIFWIPMALLHCPFDRTGYKQCLANYLVRRNYLVIEFPETSSPRLCTVLHEYSACATSGSKSK
jgi:hypothetical protein